MPARDNRYTQTGVNSAGDPMFSRTYGGEAAAGGDDYDSLTKDELSELLEERGLPKSGTKAELIARLRQ